MRDGLYGESLGFFEIKSHNYVSIFFYDTDLLVSFAQIELYCSPIAATNDKPNPVGAESFESHAMEYVKSLPADTSSFARYYNTLQVDLMRPG